MNIEHKFIDLKALKVSDEGPGTIEGYRSVFNVIDEGGDLITPGAFKDCIAEYLETGFTAHSHDWDFDKAVGYPVEAHEDEHGWYVKSQFHSTPDAQAVRTKAKERMDAGKKVGFSFGYAVDEFSHIEAKDYEKELAQYVKADQLKETLAKAQKFNRVRVLKKVHAIEDSLVTSPMNKRAAATAVKSISEDEAETKSVMKCKPEDMKPGMPWCLYSEDGDKLLGQHATREECVAQERSMAGKPKSKSECNCPSGTDVDNCPHTTKVNPNLKEDSVSDSFESFESAESAIKKFAQKMHEYHDIRTKEGRMLSSSNRAKVQACMDKIMELHAELSDLMDMSAPKPKEKEIDVTALRTQWQRLEGEVLATLSR